jgi:glycosyltransferase involved in cell wall biosynthesis
MRIGINASWMTPGASGGLEWYCRNLIEQLAAIDSDNDYVLVTGPNNYGTFALPGPNWKMIVYEGTENAPDSYLVTVPSGAQVSARQPVSWLRRLYGWFDAARKPQRWTGHLRDLIKAEQIQLWFCPMIYALPLDTDVPIVACVPDLQHEHYPEFFSDEERAQRAMGYQHSCKAAAAVITISQAAAKDMVDLYDVDQERVFAIPLGLDSSFESIEQGLRDLVMRARLKYRLDENYIYYPAAAWAHKNHDNLLRGLAIARDRGFDHKLILTGWEFDLMSRIAPLLRTLKLRDRVVHLGYVTRADVVGILGGARAMIFPSLFEGFGLPVVEAMHLGVPVACGNLCSLPEVGGAAVQFFDPKSPPDIAEAILKLTGDDLIRRRLVDAGRVQAAKFNYRLTATETLKVFEKIRTGELNAPDLPPFRPPIAHNWILDAHSRWYFHCADLGQVDLELSTLAQFGDQRVQVLLDGQSVVESDLFGSEPQRISIDSNGHARGGFHRLDIIASSKIEVKGEILSVRVTELRVHDTNGRATNLVR